jgi:hypothetical protein
MEEELHKGVTRDRYAELVGDVALAMEPYGPEDELHEDMAYHLGTAVELYALAEEAWSADLRGEFETGADDWRRRSSNLSLGSSPVTHDDVIQGAWAAAGRAVQQAAEAVDLN